MAASMFGEHRKRVAVVLLSLFWSINDLPIVIHFIELHLVLLGPNRYKSIKKNSLSVINFLRSQVLHKILQKKFEIFPRTGRKGLKMS